MSDTPAIDYTDKDFASLRRALLELARYRLPEWTDRSPADLGVLLVDLMAYAGDVVLYYQDRIASESFLHTATERRSVLHLLRLIGYELGGPAVASAGLTLVFREDGATIPSGAQFATADGQAFEYLGPALTVAGRDYDGLPVRHGRSVAPTVLGASTGEPGQAFALPESPAIADSIDIDVDEGAGFVRWERREHLLGGGDAREFAVRLDETGAASVVFGDGVFGRVPTGIVRAAYRVGGGVIGNVGANTIVQARTSIAGLDAVTNPAPASGGAEAETIEHAVRFGPLAFRSGERAVTEADFVALAHRAGGVAKVRARSRGWNRIDLYVAPEGPVAAPAPDDLKRRLVAFFAERRMVGTEVFIKDPDVVEIDIAVAVLSEHNHDPAAVRARAEAAVRDLLAFANVDFARPLYLSKVYEAVEALPGVFAATVTRFRRRGVQPPPLPQLEGLPEEVLRSLRGEIPPEGRIDIGEFELPAAGEVVVTAAEVVT
jgi:hypothetical protein